MLLTTHVSDMITALQPFFSCCYSAPVVEKANEGDAAGEARDRHGEECVEPLLRLFGRPRLVPRSGKVQEDHQLDHQEEPGAEPRAPGCGKKGS
eukprot:7017711-Pyramimonas_sp.AAC.3